MTSPKVRFALSIDGHAIRAIQFISTMPRATMLVSVQAQGRRKSKLTIDASLLATILTLSLRELFGDLESHSYGMSVDDDDEKFFRVSCPKQSQTQVRAALTMPTIPSFLDRDALICMDVVDVSYSG